MAGTVNGGLKAAKKNTKRDPDFYKRIGRIGGSRTGMKGFAVNRELARRAGAVGGKKSKRGKSYAKPGSYSEPEGKR